MGVCMTADDVAGPGTPLGEVIAAHLDELALPGVLSVRGGFKFTGGWPVGATPAVVVTVADKSSSPPGGALLPASVGGVAVDVRQASPAKRAALDGELGVAAVMDGAPDRGGVPVFPGEIRPDGSSVNSGVAPLIAAEAAAAAKPQLPYAPPDGVPLAPVTATVTVQACASPDAGWPVLSAFLAGVESSVTIGLYDWTSAHVLTWFTDHLAGRTVRLVLDHPVKNPTADQTDEQTVTVLQTALGADVTQAWALERGDPFAAAWQFPSAYHIKVAVADHARVWLSSGNWNNSNQPDITPATNPADADAARNGDRDWHVVIDSPALAATFEAYLANDLTVAQAHQITPAATPTALTTSTGVPAVVAPAVQTPPFAEFYPPTIVTEQMTITPVLTPDAGSYAPTVQALITSATVSLYMQFQYIELPQTAGAASPAFTALLAAVVDRQNAGVDVRIIMSEYETAGYLEQLITAGLHVATVVKIQNNVHNKGIVVDGSTVLVSSQNWSNAGTTTNRDAGVILANPTLAAYFQTLFLHDWTTLAAQAASDD